MHTKNVRMRPVPLWGRCTGSTDFTSRKKNTRKTNGATKQHSMRDQRQLWKSFSSSFASFEFTYYLENRDPEFKEKMDRLLILYKEIQVTIDSGEEPDMPTFSFDEKPGIQILEGTAPDLMPDPEKGHACVARDYEYIRHGTLSLLAGLNLNDGTVVPLVRRTHTSRDFIDFLDILDKKYPQYSQIRVILDNHSAHRSKEVMEYLKTKQDRFVFVFTPKHGSWLNLIESFFGKMAKTMLRGIRASSYDELADRIYKYIDRVNEEPVVYRWTYKMDEVEV